MQLEAEQKQTQIQGVPRRVRFLKACAGLMAAVLIFTLGVGVGDGHIRLGAAASSTAVKGLPAQLDYSSVNKVYDALKANYDGQLTGSQLVEGLKHGLATATGDPYTEYFTAKEAQNFSDELNNSFSGIGAELGKDDQGNLLIIAPVHGTPADKAGLKAQDIITAINGESTTGLDIDTAVNKIRGDNGSKVQLQVLRGKSQVLNFSIVRQTIQIPSVNSKILPGNIGYVQIVTFSDDTSALIKQAADKMAQAHVKGIILDLRDNPGGLVTAAIDTASQWLPEGTTILQEKGTTGTRTDTATGGDSLHGIPTVVLINGGTASAAEITSAALHDNKAAMLIGEKSYGKGVEQNIINFTDGSELKVTTARWYRPNGQNINKKGITPDKIVKLSDSDAKAGNDTQLKAAEEFLKSH